MEIKTPTSTDGWDTRELADMYPEIEGDLARAQHHARVMAHNDIRGVSKTIMRYATEIDYAADMALAPNPNHRLQDRYYSDMIMRLRHMEEKIAAMRELIAERVIA